jgi:hypothetical protein
MPRLSFSPPDSATLKRILLASVVQRLLSSPFKPGAPYKVGPRACLHFQAVTWQALTSSDIRPAALVDERKVDAVPNDPGS